jgi:hypothetical protein
LYRDENRRDDQRMSPVAPLKGSNQNGWYPANDDSNVWNHGQDNDERANNGRKIKANNRQGRADEDAINQAYQELPSKISGDIAIDFRQELRHFVPERRFAQR